MKKYCWKSTGFKADAQKVGEELENIEMNNAISSESVLEYAYYNKDSELYKCFEWDNTIAGEKYRKIQATMLISSISFKIEENNIEKQRVYISIKSHDEENRQFKTIKSVLDDDKEYNILLKKARTDLEKCTTNYNELIKREDLKNIIFEIYKEI